MAAKHHELLRHAAALEKTLAAATKNRDEAITALEESRKREQDLLASTAEREKLFEEQLFSIAKSLSGILSAEFSLLFASTSCYCANTLLYADASGLSFDAQALRREDALAGAVAIVEDRSASLQGTLTKAKGVLSRIRKDLTPKAELIDNLEDLVESLAVGIPMDFKNSQRSVGATMALAMV